MSPFVVLVVLAFLATAVVLVFGIYSLAHGEKEDRERSDLLMHRRVLFQAIALGLILLAVALSTS